MPHIELGNDMPGILALFAYRQDTGAVLSELSEVLLRGPSPLSRGERELIGAYVSGLNGTRFCANAHGAFAAAQLEGGESVVRSVLDQPTGAPVTARLRALLRIAAEVREEAGPVSAQALAAARAEGADDREIHDTVLIAAAFCMFNRYVDGLATDLPQDPGYYTEAAKVIVAHGYAMPQKPAEEALHA
ncbi:carboxymuconolactone decarboxylase family protein [Streptomyces clavuligerus]|nr:carboxymuconolactone decarboxylase family protein [Streptomyces clavuligerus]ANW22594.1 alkylhydroperoxidase [Streptomyces clavuligerus]AXU16936.1 alkylhydroperoxidase [Streptomyces clavuligerus]MBY6306826.1 carboxymuconolactone decarboxylase family protein [Streptomyces clavuligerus]QCS10575.1 alkylhydroperoxidase [Streptomyces clavuligerus]QPJ97388.1 alkylhydroperoxidase [Streptomyces clavuligerus]